jgi:hypothetical protein
VATKNEDFAKLDYEHLLSLLPNSDEYFDEKEFRNKSQSRGKFLSKNNTSSVGDKELVSEVPEVRRMLSNISDLQECKPEKYRSFSGIPIPSDPVYDARLVYDSIRQGILNKKPFSSS